MNEKSDTPVKNGVCSVIQGSRFKVQGSCLFVTFKS